MRNFAKETVGCYFHKPLSTAQFVPVTHVILGLDGTVIGNVTLI